ncbi:hypothetical protein J6590_019623 [Homalodisca vitripennis]|nr:hypothetical protein J6590_019623 [Homalodisca vitripennis]
MILRNRKLVYLRRLYTWPYSHSGNIPSLSVMTRAPGRGGEAAGGGGGGIQTVRTKCRSNSGSRHGRFSV